MKFHRYTDTEPFRGAVLELLLENEVQNNLMISVINGAGTSQGAGWLLATVAGSGGETALTALCVKPFVIMLYETGNIRNDDALELLAREIRLAGCNPPGVMAEPGLARRFADVFSAGGVYKPHMSMIAMRLDALKEYKKAPGFPRLLDAKDMSFAPYWERAFSEDCRAQAFSISENAERLKNRLGRGTHYIWEDGVPVSQAVYGRETPNGAIINGVYTPPYYRGHGYAKSVVAALSASLLGRAKAFCCLLADANNPISCPMYRNLGYYDVCALEDIRFDTKRQRA